MKKGIFDKLLGFVGFEEEYVDEEESLEPYEPETDERPNRPSPRAKVLTLTAPQLKSMRLVVVEPRSFEEVQQIADHLKDRRPVILNLENTDKGLAKRIVDFVSGAVYALEGGMQKINTSIFLFTPSNIDILANPGFDGRPTFTGRD